MSITKSELIERVADKQSQLSSKDVELAIKTILEEMSKTLATGGRIEIRGFGSFSLHYREPRVGRNPKTGESVELDAKYVPHFKPGKELRDRVNQSMQLEQDLSDGGGIIEAGEGQPDALREAIREKMGGSPGLGRSSSKSTGYSSGSDSGDTQGEAVLASGSHAHRSSGSEQSTGFLS